jgi:hypothetical protein
MPVIELLGQALAGQPLPLPGGVVGILHSQWWQWIGLALDEGAIQRAELVDQDAQRPAIGDDVMLGNQQTARHRPEATGGRGSAVRGQIERRQRFLAAELRDSLRSIAMPLQIVLDQGKRLSRAVMPRWGWPSTATKMVRNAS